MRLLLVLCQPLTAFATAARWDLPIGVRGRVVVCGRVWVSWKWRARICTRFRNRTGLAGSGALRFVWVCSHSSKGPYLVLPNGTCWGHDPGHPNCALPNLAPAPALPGMLLPLPYLGATITWTACSCSQYRRNEASRPVAEESGSGLAGPCSRWLWMWPLHLLCFGPLRVFIFAAPVSAMPALAERSIPLAGI